jgi:ABC-type amino acid transport substrate-binding protein
MRLQPTDTVAATDSNTTHVKITEPHLTVGLADSNTRSIEAQVAAATALAERMTVATAAEAPDVRANDRGRPLRNAEKIKSLSANDIDLLAILLARPDTKSVADLSGKTIAIDDRYSASNGGVRTAIVAAGAPEVQLSEGQTTAFNRLVDGEVPAAVLALVSAEAATAFPEIAGFKIFFIPLSPRALKERP